MGWGYEAYGNECPCNQKGCTGTCRAETPVKSAKIFKLGDHPESPEMLLRTVLANVENMESVVVSVIADGHQVTFWTEMDHASTAYHAVAVMDDMTADIKRN